MTFAERVDTIAAFGVTERQARFLVTVMLHAGVCLARQYCAFAGIAYGAPVQNFFRSLVARRFATPQTCAHGRARLFHVHYKPLYAAIGEPDNRFRRPSTLARAVERLMLLDAVLADSRLTWLGTEREKVRHFTSQTSARPQDLPAIVFRSTERETVRYFPEKLPIGIGDDGRTNVFPFLVTRPSPMLFRLFVERHAELWRALPAWTVRLLVPRHLRAAAAMHRRAFSEHVSPVSPEVADELRWYFETCRGEVADRDDERYYRAQSAYAAARFRALYRLWLTEGEGVLDAARSPVLASAVERGSGTLECQVLPHPYLHLLPLVGTA